MQTFIKKWTLTRTRILLLLSLSLVLQLSLSYTLKGFAGDLEDWKEWMQSLRVHQLAGIYLFDASVNYPPVFLALLWVYQLFVKNYDMFTLKLPAILFNLLTLAGIIYFFKKIGLTSVKYRLLILYLFFSPVIVYISSIWGQVDFVHSSLMCLSLVALPYYPLASGIIYGLALLTKMQAIVIAPVFIFYLYRMVKNKNAIVLRSFVLGFAAPWVLFSVYFTVNHSFVAFINHSYITAVGYYPYVSMYAMNIWFNIMGVSPQTPDTVYVIPYLTYRTLGLILLSAFALYSMYYLRSFRQLKAIHLLKAGFLLSFSFYMLPTEIHDRYIIPAVIFVIFIAFMEKKKIWFILMAGMELDTVTGLTLFLKKDKYPWMGQLASPAALMFLFLFIMAVVVTWIELRQEKRERTLPIFQGIT